MSLDNYRAKEAEEQERRAEASRWDRVTSELDAWKRLAIARGQERNAARAGDWSRVNEAGVAAGAALRELRELGVDPATGEALVGR